MGDEALGVAEIVGNPRDFQRVEGAERRRLAALLGFASFAASHANGQTEPLPKAETILDRYVEVTGGKASAFRVANAFSIIGISNNLGDAKSLVTHPATTTHQRLTPEARAELGISEGFVRFSAGLEHADDLIEDLDAALEKA
jgi:O-acetylhomoserine/O-acetylserine sulfhydrylase-like pyridoxal-dependent enzyme